MNVIFSFFSNRRASSDILFESSKNWDLFQESWSVLQDFENISNNLEGTCNTCFADGLRCNSSATATMCSLPNGYDTTDTSLNISITSSQRLELCFSFCEFFGFWGDDYRLFCQRQRRGGSWWVAPIIVYPLSFTAIRELAPLFSPNRHGPCEATDNLTIVKVGIRFPSFLPYRHFKRKRTVEDSILDFYKRLLRVQAHHKCHFCQNILKACFPKGMQYS